MILIIHFPPPTHSRYPHHDPHFANAMMMIIDHHFANSMMMINDPHCANDDQLIIDDDLYITGAVCM